MDTTTIGDLRVSRLLLGSNPFSGFSHQGVDRDERMVHHYTVARIKEALFEEAIIASFVVFFFLMHLRTTVTVLPTLPLALAGSFILMYAFGKPGDNFALGRQMQSQIEIPFRLLQIHEDIALGSGR